MINFPKRYYRGDTRGVAWPDTGNSNRNNVEDVFGPRPFSPHIPTIGFDYDFHRGIDVDLGLGDPLYSSIQGSVARLHFTHFGWEVASQLNPWTVNGSIATFTVDAENRRLLIDADTPNPLPDTTWPVSTARLEQRKEPVFVGDDWVMEIQFDGAFAVKDNLVGIAIYDEINDEYVGIEYDGQTIFGRGVDSGGAMAGDGANFSIGSQIWLRIEQVSGTVNWLYGTDGENWTVLATDPAPAFTDTTRSIFIPWIYYYATTGGVTEQFAVATVNYVDADTIGRFGNWMEICDQNNRKVVNLHLREPIVALGDKVQAGQQIGTAGQTGFDVRSGRILSPHVHIELIENNDYFYANDDPINPLKPGFYPRVNVNNNVTGVLTEENDPNGDPSWRLHIVVNRADQDFDLNRVFFGTFTGIGDGTVFYQRIVDFNTRAGLNPDPDIPDFNDVYIVAFAFDQNSGAYEIDFYFDKVGLPGTFDFWEVYDTEGTLLASS